MLKIALCEDDAEEQKATAQLIKRYQSLHQEIDIRLKLFSSGEELLDYIEEKGGYDLYLLDVIMPDTDGIQTGIHLRKRQDNGLIIYLTSSPDFAIESFQVQPFYYLLKPIKEELLFPVLEKACIQIKAKKSKVIPVKTKDSLRLLPLHSILFAELSGRMVRYHLTDNSVIDSLTFRGAFKKEIAPLLKFDNFLLCGSSFAVNLLHVTSLEKTDLIMSNGQRVPIPRKFYSEVKRQWLLFWLEGENQI